MSTFEHPFAPRRIITGVQDGKAVFLSDGPVPTTHHYSHVPGMTTSVLYATASVPVATAEAGETMPLDRHVLPAPGETVLMIVAFPPDSVMTSPEFDPMAAAGEQLAFVPGLPERFEPEHPGKHRTDSIDYDIVLDGEIWLELDDETKHLTAGDIAVQGATRHAWRNRSDSITTMCFVFVGIQPPQQHHDPRGEQA